jgi:hypothetical protein
MRGAVAGLALFALGLIPAQLSGVQDEVYVLVASSDVRATNLSSEEVRLIFLLRRRYWQGGQPINILLTESSLRPGSFLLEKIYRGSYADLRRLILEKLYRGEIDLAPKVVPTEASAVQFVNSGAGLLTLVRHSSIEGTKSKLLTVDGKSPTSEDYPLKR